MNTNPNNPDLQTASVAEESVVAYGRPAADAVAAFQMGSTVSKPGRMTPEEYFGILQKMVDEYYDSIQSWDEPECGSRPG